MNLYDTPADIVAKAMRGLGRMPADLESVTLEEISGFLAGRFDPGIAGRLADALDLDRDALAGYNQPWPVTDLPADVHPLVLPFEDEEVNAWRIRGPEGVLVIDAGLGKRDLSDALEHDGPIDLLITHPHRDHIGGVGGVRERLRSLAAPVGLPGSSIIRPGDRIRLSGLEIEVFDLAGHHPDAVGLGITSPDWNLVAVGDAVFSGSMGGCPDPLAFRQARRSIAAGLFGRAADTLLLPGHGPATTLAVEYERNPFLAAWRKESAAGA